MSKSFAPNPSEAFKTVVQRDLEQSGGIDSTNDLESLKMNAPGIPTQLRDPVET